MLLEPAIFEALWSSFDKVSRRSSNPPHSVNVYCFFPTLITCKHLHQIENGFLQCIPPGWGSVLLLLNQIFIKTSFLSPTRIVHTCTHQSTFYSVVFCSYGHICWSTFMVCSFVLSHGHILLLHSLKYMTCSIRFPIHFNLFLW
jgi:hypothetical protein